MLSNKFMNAANMTGSVNCDKIVLNASKSNENLKQTLQSQNK